MVVRENLHTYPAPNPTSLGRGTAVQLKMPHAVRRGYRLSTPRGGTNVHSEAVHVHELRDLNNLGNPIHGACQT
jgi:hypothetical protein